MDLSGRLSTARASPREVLGVIQRLAATFALIVIASAGASVLPLPTFADVGVGSWSVTGSLLGGHPDETVVTLANGRVLVVHADDEEVTPDHPTFTERLATELYEPVSGTWTSGPAPPVPDASTIVPLADGGALLLGESTCGAQVFRCLPTNATYRLDARDSTWTPAAPMHEARARPTAVQLADGRVLVAGGFGDSCTPRIAFGYSCAALSSAEIFDPATGTWSPTTPLPTPHGGAGATLLSDGTVLLVGGGQTDDALRYTPAAQRWTTLGPSSAPTGSTLLALPGDRAIALGSEPEAGFYGSYGGAGARARTICDASPQIYTPQHSSWIPAPPLPEEPISCSTNAVQLRDGQILYSAKGRYVLDPRDECWATTGAPVTRHDGILVALLDGGALDVGHSREGGYYAGVEIYAPGSQTCSAAQQLKTSMYRHLAPQGTAAKIRVVLQAGYSFSLRPIRPGRLRIDWYFTRSESEGRPGPILVGAGHADSNRGGALRLALALTAAGRRLLERDTYVSLSATGSFTARDGESVTATRSLTLTR